MNKKGSAPSVVASYRKRQQRAQQLLMAFWIGAMLLVIAAGYLAYLLLAPDAPPAMPAVDTTETPAAQNSTGNGTATNGSLTNQATVPAAVVPIAGTGSAPLESQAPLSAATLAPTTTLITPKYSTYTVQQGDTLVGIASYFNTDLATLMQLNPSITPELLHLGDELKVPAQPASQNTPTSAIRGPTNTIEYQVAAGDTLAGIATVFGTTIAAIVQQNNLDSPDQIQVGQTLLIPVPETPESAGSQATETPQGAASP